LFGYRGLLTKEEDMLSIQDSIVILAIVAVLFGAKRLPELGRGVGQAMKNFKKGLSEPDEINVTPKKDEPINHETEKNDGK